MYKPSNNPKVAELTKSYKKRNYSLSCLQVIKTPEGKRFCVWCQEVELHRGNQKYCSELCSQSAWAWANPQREEGLHVLLARQNFKCKCGYDYMPWIEEAICRLNKRSPMIDPITIYTKTNWLLMKWMKRMGSSQFKPEVDHLVPISKGGSSLGLDNHQVLCYTCHKAKTKIDNSGKRKKK